MLIAGVLFATVLLRFALVGVAAYLLLPFGPGCPRCSAAMTQIRRPLLRFLVPGIEQRWCMECGWSGIVRRGRIKRGSVTPA